MKEVLLFIIGNCLLFCVSCGDAELQNAESTINAIVARRNFTMNFRSGGMLTVSFDTRETYTSSLDLSDGIKRKLTGKYVVYPNLYSGFAVRLTSLWEVNALKGIVKADVVGSMSFIIMKKENKLCLLPNADSDGGLCS